MLGNYLLLEVQLGGEQTCDVCRSSEQDNTGQSDEGLFKVSKKLFSQHVDKFCSQRGHQHDEIGPQM